MRPIIEFHHEFIPINTTPIKIRITYGLAVYLFISGGLLRVFIFFPRHVLLSFAREKKKRSAANHWQLAGNNPGLSGPHVRHVTRTRYNQKSENFSTKR